MVQILLSRYRLLIRRVPDSDGDKDSNSGRNHVKYEYNRHHKSAGGKRQSSIFYWFGYEIVVGSGAEVAQLGRAAPL